MPTRSLYKWTLIILFAIVAPFSQATSPCHIKSGCIDEASATLIGIIDVYEQACAEGDPGRAEQYHAKARKEVATGNTKEDADFLGRLRGSTIYAEMVPKLKLAVGRLEQKQLVEKCEIFFFGSSGQHPTVA